MPKSRVPEVPSVPESKIEDDLDVDGGTADEEAVRKEGALNVAAAQAGRRERDAIGKKRAGTARVSFGDDNACLLYDATVQLYAAPTLAILVERTSGSSRLSWYLHSEPANGAALYQAIQVQCHGRSEESVYKVTLKDKAAKTWRGVGWLTLPNTLGDMPVPQQAPAHIAPPTYAPPTYGAPSSPPAAPAGGDVVSQLLSQIANLNQQVMTLATRGGPPAAAVAAPAPPPAPAYPGAPPPGAPPPPKGSMMYLQGIGWVQVAGDQPPPPPAPPAAAAAPQNPADYFRSAIATVKEASQLTKEAGAIAAPAPAAAAVESPAVTKTEVGGYTLMSNTDDGQLRPVETFIANGDKLFGWISKEREKWTAAQEKNLKIEQENLAQKAALAQREKELQDAHTRLLAYQAAIARGELVSIPLEPAPAAEPPPPPPPAAPTPEPAIHVNGTNGAARPAPGVAKARPPRMAPPTLPGTG